MSQSTYSSARQGLIEDSMTYAEEDELLADVMDEIYETFLISAVLSGAVSIPDFWENKDAYFPHRFEKPPKDWIDPVKEATAAQVALRTGQKTFKQIAAENGSDWRKQIADICEPLMYAKENFGVDLGGVILGQTQATGLYGGENPPDGDGSAADTGNGEPPDNKSGGDGTE